MKNVNSSSPEQYVSPDLKLIRIQPSRCVAGSGGGLTQNYEEEDIFGE